MAHMARRRDEDPDNWTALYVEIERATHDGLRRVAEAEHRTVSGEVRRLIEVRIAEFDAEQQQAA